MIVDGKGSKRDSILKGLHWNVFRGAITSNQNRIDSMHDVIVSVAITEARSDPSATIDSSDAIAKFAPMLEPADTAFINSCLDLSKNVGRNSFLGMLLWYTLAEDRQSTWIATKIVDDNSQTYQLIQDGRAETDEFIAWHPNRHSS
jgi:hypothetical protein